jgi:hypothetical protein
MVVLPSSSPVTHGGFDPTSAPTSPVTVMVCFSINPCPALELPSPPPFPHFYSRSFVITVGPAGSEVDLMPMTMDRVTLLVDLVYGAKPQLNLVVSAASSGSGHTCSMKNTYYNIRIKQLKYLEHILATYV